MKDVKITSKIKRYKGEIYVSTDDNSFLGAVGQQIREQFPDKCKYEIQKGVIMPCGGKRTKRKKKQCIIRKYPIGMNRVFFDNKKNFYVIKLVSYY